ncbi:beta-N-acetylhexosaminidase [Niabella terrae]
MAQDQFCPVIPQPLVAERQGGAFLLTAQTNLLIQDRSFAGAAQLLRQALLTEAGLPLVMGKTAAGPAIRFISDEQVGYEEGYVLKINPSGIEIRARQPAGAFYGAVSLLQLILASKAVDGIRIPAWQIKDQPRYRWRGLMLDESRHFFGKATVKSLLDWMAYYKLNVFHWHLTDQPGWRLEIKKYPRLAPIGGIGNHSDSLAPARYYSQADIREIVAYATARQIQVVPEIDMPGHATAANRAYPEYSGGGSAKHPEFTFNPGREETYRYLTDILREVNVLFPSRLIHLGGDEVSYGNEKWQTDPYIKQLMTKQNLRDAVAVERYFMQRMADSVYKLNAHLLAWDEVAAMDLDKDKTIIFWWRHDQPEQLKKALDNHYQVVLCPRLPLYFDFVQDSTDQIGRKWGKKFNPLKAVYAFDVDSLTGPADFSPDALVRGIQANLWTETVSDQRRLYYMIFPRIAALAENAWTPRSRRNFTNFQQRLQGHYQLYDKAHIYYYKPGRPEATNY